MKTPEEIIQHLLKKKSINKIEAAILLSQKQKISIKEFMELLKTNDLLLIKKR